ncbi:MAG: hypothetical protein EHM87_21700 [Burkholderiales bacterium]|nr:MAG: hypothetical protein EHM87_21700 [Burkholderiales bacterium]
MQPLDALRTEYGISPYEVTRQWAALNEPKVPPKIKSAAHYVGICRRLNPALSKEAGVDGRLLAVGFNHFTPTDWVGGEFAAFLSFWTETQPKPNTVGSTWNALPETVFAIWRASPSVQRAMKMVPPNKWYMFVRDDKILRRNVRRSVPIARALKRASAQHVILTAHAARALGTLPPELQAYALMGQVVVTRTRTIDWERVAKMRDDLQTEHGPRLRLAIAAAGFNWSSQLPRHIREEMDRLGVGKFGKSREEALAAFLCPAYPNTTVERAARLALGDTPVQLSMGILTKKEAHEWLRDGWQDPLSWLVAKLAMPGVPRLRSVSIVRWLHEVQRRGAWAQLTKARTVHGPGGVVAEVRYIDRIDEIQDEDLVRWAKTLVEEAFAHAAERLGAAWQERMFHDHTPLAQPPKWKLYQNSMRVLNTPAELAAEGRDLQHCVGGYEYAVRSGQSVILGINVRGNRSTAELTPEGQVRQHRGLQNRDPHPWCQAVLDRFQKRNQIGGAP